MRPQPEDAEDHRSDIDVQILLPAPASIEYSTTPFIPSTAVEKAPPGFVKDARGYVPKPADLSFEEAACLPCAGVTAWSRMGAPLPSTASFTVALPTVPRKSGGTRSRCSRQPGTLSDGRRPPGDTQALLAVL